MEIFGEATEKKWFKLFCCLVLSPPLRDTTSFAKKALDSLSNLEFVGAELDGLDKITDCELRCLSIASHAGM